MNAFIPTSSKLSCVPLYAAMDLNYETVSFLGTGTLITFNKLDLIVTAAHVLDNENRFELIVAGPQKPILFNRRVLMTSVRPGLTRQTDPMDFCCMSLSPDEAAQIRVRFRFIDWHREALIDVPPIEWPHKIMGYPDTENILQEETIRLSANCLSIEAMEDRSVIQHAPWDGIKAHPTWYLGLRYDPRPLEKRAVQPKVKSLHGCSGGAMWRTTGPRVVGYAGMVLQCHSPKPRRTGERIVYGFRSQAMNDILSCWFRRGQLSIDRVDSSIPGRDQHGLRNHPSTAPRRLIALEAPSPY